MTLPESPKGCPMDTILRLLMGPWTTYILYVLRSRGPTRFGELKRQVGGISAKMLTERLRLLEAAEVVRRDYVPNIPPQVTYSLAPRGHELSGVIDQLDKIARRWAAEESQAAKKPPRAKPRRAAA
jgi:DNA-binding HxlR family transcriptional regulator